MHQKRYGFLLKSLAFFCAPKFPLSAGFAITRQEAIHAFYFITGRYFHFHFFRQTFHFLAIQAPEMKMIVVVVFRFAVLAKGKVIFTVVGGNFMHEAVLTEAVQYPVNRNPVHGSF